MAEVTANYSDYQQFEPKKEEIRSVISDSQQENGECGLGAVSPDHVDMIELLKKGHMQYGYYPSFFTAI